MNFLFNRLLSIFVVVCFYYITAQSSSATNYTFEEYLNRIDTIVKTRLQFPKSIFKKQREELIENKNIKELNLKNKKGENYKTYQKRRKKFDIDGGKASLIKEWEKNTNRGWPTYTKADQCRNSKECEGNQLEAHHVIPLGYNGLNRWWNIFPLTMDEHTGKDEGIHSSKEARFLFSKVKKK